LGNKRDQSGGVGDGGQINEEHPVPEAVEQVVRKLGAETCLSDSTRPGEGEQAHVVAKKDLARRCQLFNTSNNRVTANWQVVRNVWRNRRCGRQYLQAMLSGSSIVHL